MELFFAVLLGCSDSLTLCDELERFEIAARSEDACAEMTLASDAAATADYPTVLAECRVVEEPVLADASGG